jgi:AICAR transformylase/IMP cyclohydrolase PurH
LSIIPDDELIIMYYPKNWEQNSYYYKNKKWVQDMLNTFKQCTSKDSMFQNIEFYLIEKKLVDKFNHSNLQKTTEIYHEILDSPLFIMYYIFFKHVH